jgi:hypothetical protein
VPEVRARYYMADYGIDWVIENMRAWISRQELLRRAETDFPGLSTETLIGCPCQYWTDSIHPIYGRPFRRRGLRAEERGTGRDRERRIVQD